MMRFWASVDPDDYPDQAQWERDRDGCDADAVARYENEFLRRSKQRRFGRESARRQKRFAQARQVLAVAAKVRGTTDNTGITAWNSSGHPAELSLRIGDQEFVWRPRRGYFFRDIDELPF
jgi:hypothetical protein